MSHSMAGPKSGLLIGAAPQALVNLAWGLSHLNCQEEGVWAALSSACRGQLHTFLPWDLAQLAWSYASAGRQDVLLFDELATEAAGRVDDFNAQVGGTAVLWQHWEAGCYGWGACNTQIMIEPL